jgi:hypothetical protein
MLSDRQKIEYAKSYLRRKTTGDNLTSGVLVTGRYYRLTILGTGDDFTNIGASARSLHRGGETFKSTGPTPTTWSHGSVLNEIRIDNLKTVADTTYGTATDTVTLTSSAFEGGTGSGEITFEKVLLGQAIEELIQEFDPGYITPSPIPRKSLGAVVQLGYGCGGYGRSGL